LSVLPSAIAPAGFLVHSFGADDWRTCRDYVLDRLGHARKQKRRPDPRVDRSAPALQLWNAAKDPEAIVRRYHHRRHLDLADDVAGRVVRFHPRCPWQNEAGNREFLPVMLTAFRSIADDRLVAVHRTLLTEDGQKLARRMLGPVADAAIEVSIDEDVEYGLAIGEGYETALAGRMLGLGPVWAIGSAGGIASFPVLSGIDVLTLMAELDDAGANARAIHACGQRWLDAGREVLTATPRFGDMNDVVTP
jgi:hypothetical protein